MLSPAQIIKKTKVDVVNREEAKERLIEGLAIELFNEMKRKFFSPGAYWYIDSFFGLRKRYCVKDRFFIETMYGLCVGRDYSSKEMIKIGKAAVNRFWALIKEDERLKPYSWWISNETYVFNFFSFDLKCTIKEFPPE